jgi:hypothetical protein
VQATVHTRRHLPVNQRRAGTSAEAGNLRG